MLGIKAHIFAPIVNMSLEELVPPDHFYRHLERSLDLTFVRELVQPCYATGGRRSIDPVVFFKLQLIMFFEGIRSERQLLRVAADRLSLRWYLGYDLHEPLPDHSSLTKIRDRYGITIFRRFFDHIVEQCQQVVRSFLPSVLSDQEQYALPPRPPRQPAKTTVFASRCATKTYPFWRMDGSPVLHHHQAAYTHVRDRPRRPATRRRSGRTTTGRNRLRVKLVMPPSAATGRRRSPPAPVPIRHAPHEGLTSLLPIPTSDHIKGCLFPACHPTSLPSACGFCSSRSCATGACP